MAKGNTMGSREDIVLTKKQQLILIGKILGDGFLEKNGKHTRLKICQCERQKEYVYWMYREFKTLATKEPYFIKVASQYRRVGQYRFSTFSLAVFDCYRKLFYQNRRKIIPNSIDKILKEPLTLAVWYMDDGYKRTDKSGLYLCTSSFNQHEHNLLQNSLFINFGIETNIHFAGGYARLHIPSRHKNRFCTLIRPHVVPSLDYKLL